MYCFDKTQRLLRKSEYDDVFQQAQKMVTAEVILLYRANNLGHARLGLVIAKKKIPMAHDRNRLKRLLRETFRQSCLPAVDVIVLARQGIDVSNSITTVKLSKTWDKLATLCKK